MRIKVTFRAEKLPILYRHRFMALIKEALEKSDADYKESLYPDKNSEHSKVAKPFCFSVSMPSGKTAKKEKIVIDEGVEIEDTVFYFPQGKSLSFYVSSCDYQFMMCLYNGLLEIKAFDFGNGITLRLDRVFMLNEKKINGDEVVFKTNSPILIEDKDGKPLLPADSEISKSIFNEHFNAIHDRIVKDIRGEGLYRDMEFVPVKLKKQVVKHTLKGFREKTGKPYMTLTCFEGCFKLKGDPRDLQMLYQIGIGLRTGQGFGMVEVV
ncbi:MAG: CRISPR-associated endoribonuclease Cas6 [Nitrospirae bacterium]|nr:CRISPR-associated endoribonuclease Cas6 [Nitrospirota bacterium]